MDDYHTNDTETAVSAPQEKSLPKATFREMSILLSVAGLAITFDQWTKHIIEANIPLRSIVVPFPAIEPLFRFTHIENKGAAFGMFQDGSSIFMVLAVLVSLGILYYNFFNLEGNQRLMRVALGLQMGGALGNFIDRVRIGHVTDFIDIGPWYIFNIADACIVGGAILLGYIVIQEMREEAKMKATVSAGQKSLDSEPLNSGQ